MSKKISTLLAAFAAATALTTAPVAAQDRDLVPVSLARAEARVLETCVRVAFATIAIEEGYTGSVEMVASANVRSDALQTTDGAEIAEAHVTVTMYDDEDNEIVAGFYFEEDPFYDYLVVENREGDIHRRSTFTLQSTEDPESVRALQATRACVLASYPGLAAPQQ